MKRNKSILITIVVAAVLIVGISAIAAASESGALWFKRQTTTDAYNFPEYTGDGPLYWDDAIEFYQIPDEILSGMSTDGLIETCLNYPLFAANMGASAVSMYSGFLDTCKQFNGLSELFKRDAAAVKLKDIYIQNRLDKIISSDPYSSLRMRYLEYIIAQDEILYRLSEAERSALCDACVNRFETVRNDYEGYLPPDSTLLIASKILSADDADFKELIKEYPGIDTFNLYGICDFVSEESVQKVMDFISQKAGN